LGEGVREGPSGELSTQDRLELQQIASEFGSDSRQKAKAEACAKRRGMTFVREQAEIVRSNPKIENAAGAFETACDSPEGWKRRKSAAKKATRRKPPEPKPEEPQPVGTNPDYSAQWQLWQAASEEQRNLWRQDEVIGRFEPRVGSQPRSAFLARLYTLTELAKEAAAAATALLNPQRQAAAA
jgi:hypothetical protein